MKRPILRTLANQSQSQTDLLLDSEGSLRTESSPKETSFL